MEPIQLSGFELLEKIGQGGMAVVWKARQLSLDRIVAIKFLQPQLSCDPEEVKRLLSEARAAAKLKHQGIVQVYDANETNGIYYIVMEFIAGYNVGEWLRRKGKLDERDALLVAECVATALQYAWSTAALIHCDIKPDNVMVDRDGTIKVADLGLSRTIQPRGARPTEVQEIMGTPSYIAPEQSRGDAELDCRTDIYSLGAMLYHLSTGKRLFDKHGDAEAMDLQITAQDVDPIELNPALSPGLCALIEKMLVKDRKGRQADWGEVLKDIHAVQKGRMPVSPLPPEGSSTVKRSLKRARHVVAASLGAAAKTQPPPATGRGALLAGAMALVVAGALAVWFMAGRKEQAGASVGTAPAAIKAPAAGAAAVPATPAADPAAITPTPAPVDSAREQFEFVQKWAKENPGEYQTAITRFRRVAGESRGTKYSMMAEDEAKRLETEWQKSIKDSLRPVEEAAEKLATDKRFLEAATVITNYSGKWAKETEVQREKLAEEYLHQAKEHEEEQQKTAQREDQQFGELMSGLVTQVLSGQVSRAQELVKAAVNDKQAESRSADLQAMQKILADAQNINNRVLESFRQQVGQELTVARTKGPMTFTLTAVESLTLRGVQNLAAGSKIELEVPVDDLAVQERLARMGSDDLPDVALVKGVMAVQAKAYPKAREFFQKTGPLLADPLVAGVKAIEQSAAEERAEEALARVLKSVGIEVGAYDEKTWLQAIANANPDAAHRDALAKQLDKFKERKEPSSFVAKAEPVIAALAKLCQAGKPADVAAESKKEAEPEATPSGGEAKATDPRKLKKALLDKNVGLNEEEIRMNQDSHGIVNRMEIISPAIQDLAPLAEVGTLEELAVGGLREWDWPNQEPAASIKSLMPLAKLSLRKLYVGYATISDLTALRGMRLRSLNLRYTEVRDLGPLQDAPLEDLNLSHTRVKDLTALRGKALKNLDISDTQVYDISPLSGMMLRSLNAANTQVRDILVLKGMPLRALNLAGTKVHDFTPVKGASLESLDLSDTQFRDFSFLKDMPLHGLTMRNVHLADLTVFKDMQLRSLDLRGAVFKDLDPLKGMLLESLNVSETKVHSLSPLREMPLQNLDISGSDVSDLSPLKGMKLVYLDITRTPVRDISALRQMPLERLHLDTKNIKDFSPLRGSPIQELNIEGEVDRNLRWVLDSMPNLHQVNRQRRW